MGEIKILEFDNIPENKAIMISGVMKRGETTEDFVKRLVTENKVVVEMKTLNSSTEYSVKIEYIKVKYPMSEDDIEWDNFITRQMGGARNE